MSMFCGQHRVLCRQLGTEMCTVNQVPESAPQSLGGAQVCQWQVGVVMSGQAQAGKRQLCTTRSAAQQRAMTGTVPALVAVEDLEADVAVVDCRQRVADQGAKSMVACTHLQC